MKHKFTYTNIRLILAVLFLFIKISSKSQSIEVFNSNSAPPPLDYKVYNLKSSTGDWTELAVPNYLWSYGCAPTAAAMLMGYYDRHGFYCLYNGLINDGAAPLQPEAWKENNFTLKDGSKALNYDNSISASKKGLDGHMVDGHVDDFWVQVGASGNDPDPWVAGVPPHDFFANGANCVGDYMGTSQDEFKNTDGNTLVNYYPNGSPFRYTDCGVKANCPANNFRDITQGLVEFFEQGPFGNSFYSCKDAYNQFTDIEMGDGTGFTFDQFKAEIDANRPVLLHFNSSVGGHTVIGFGYTLHRTLVLWDTWSKSRREFTWDRLLSGPNNTFYELEGVTVFIPDGSIIKSATDFLCKLGIITGLNDQLQITNPPSQLYPPGPNGEILPPNTLIITPGSSVSFYAEFTAKDCYTRADEFRWKIELFHNSGSYTYMTHTSGGVPGYPTSCKTGHHWEATAPNLPDYDWLRNEGGNISGKVTLETTDNDGAVNKSDELFIQVKPNKTIRPELTVLDMDDNSILIHMSSRETSTYKIYYEKTGTIVTANEGQSPITVSGKEVFTLSGLGWGTKIYIKAVGVNGESEKSNVVTYSTIGKLPYTNNFNDPTYNSVINRNWTLWGDNDYFLNEFSTYYNRTGVQSYSILMSSTTNGNYVSNYADLHLDLQEEKEVILEFWWTEFGDEYHPEADGVWISNDGGSSFVKIYDLIGPNYTDQAWSKHTLNISTLASNKNVKLSNISVIRFAQKDNYKYPSDGFAIDDISVYSNYTPPVPVQTLTLKATKDAMIYYSAKPGYEYVANTNYGTYDRIIADEWTSSSYRTSMKSLLEFDLSSIRSNAKIKSAHLSLRVCTPQPNATYQQISTLSTSNTGYKSNECRLYRVIEDWMENSVTYNNQPQALYIDGKSLAISKSYTQDYLNIDVKELISKMIVNSERNNGFILELTDPQKYSRMVFASSDHPNSSLHPTLTVELYYDDQIYTVPFTVSGSTTNTENNWDVNGGDGHDKEYLVYIPTATNITAHTCSESTNFDTKLEIFKTDGNTTGLYNDDLFCSLASNASGLSGVALASGYYYFVVDGYNNAMGNYELSVNSSLKSAETFDNYPTKEEANQTIIKIYPNPVNDILNVIVSNGTGSIEIIDLNGRILKYGSIQEETSTFDCSDLKSGLYVIKIYLPNKTERYLFDKL